MGLLALLLATLLAACGDDDVDAADTGPEALPAEEAPVFVSLDFDAVPVVPLAEEVGPRTEEDGVIAQSYTVRNTSREEIFDFYGEELDGWQVERPPRRLGDARDASWRALWTLEDHRLIVTVSRAPTLESEGSGDDPVVQLSLSLEPTDRPLPE